MYMLELHFAVPTAVEPTGLQLVATFLEKGGVLEGQTPLFTAEGINKDTSRESVGRDSESGSVWEGRREKLVNCALFIASFLQWDLALFEER